MNYHRIQFFQLSLVILASQRYIPQSHHLHRSWCLQVQSTIDNTVSIFKTLISPTPFSNLLCLFPNFVSLLLSGQDLVWQPATKPSTYLPSWSHQASNDVSFHDDDHHSSLINSISRSNHHHQHLLNVCQTVACFGWLKSHALLTSSSEYDLLFLYILAR